MEKITKVLLLILLSCLFFGCSTDKNQALSCTDESVKKLVIEITYEELFKQLLPTHIQQNYEEMLKELEGTDLLEEYDKIDYQGFGFVRGTLPVEYFMKFTEVSPTAKSIHEKVIQQIKDMNLTLEAIRVTSKQPDIEKVNCAAQISFANGNQIPIEYSAQYTEDGQAWVEVSGLK